jgi:hypothetical protein
MPRWPDKIAAAVTFDVAFALNFKVGRTAMVRDFGWPPIHSTWCSSLAPVFLSNFPVVRGYAGRAKKYVISST